jgi:predicted transposase/invertase (TIGR01784 family)
MSNDAVKSFKDLDLTNDYVFSKVMEDPELCRELLEMILNISILRIEYPESQKSLTFKPDSKSVRLDVYVKGDENSAYDIEMQVKKTGHLPKRSRYYQSMMDLDMLEKGHTYSALGKSFVIFICMFDPFELGRAVYSFRNRCVEERDLELGDERTTVFINAYGKTEQDSKLYDFLKYLRSKEASSEYTKALDDAVTTVLGNRKFEVEYMTLEMKIQEHKEEWLAEGRAEGKAEGIDMGVSATIRAAIKNNKTPEEVAEFLNIPIERVLAAVEEEITQNS